MGAELRKALSRALSGQEAGRYAHPRPHVRVAHRHRFRTGPMKEPENGASSSNGCGCFRWVWAKSCRP